ncbi:MAG TPA: hypothetical protein VFN74_20550 [Chloroflexota bacterium]|nr:hypothetical protein [Chloroflexota bacterium]
MIGAVALAGLVLLLRQDPNAAVPPGSVPSVAAPQAAQPAQQIDWKLKGAPAAPVLVEEWGDFQ